MTSEYLIETYDMIIFGFADSYRDEEFTTNSANNIQKFKDSGKSIMFSHDLTSQINNSDYVGKTTKAEVAGTFMETTNGAGFNKYIRDIMGLNRFGDTTRTVNGTLGDPAGYYDNTSIGDKYAFTYTALMQYSNFRRAWEGGETITDSEYPGPYKNLFSNLGTTLVGYPEISFGYETQYVTNVNDGQITKYPFDLDAECASDKTEHGYKIAPTHGQYYQLNLEAEDVVCWYALSDDKSGNGWYSASPNDAANNYYIYNKGNITYSGIGHRGGTEVTTFEQKLFINTIIAALRAGIEGPQPHITNGYNVPETDEDRYVVYADVDADSDDEDFNSSQNVEFYVTDDSSSNSVGDTLYVALEVATDEKDENGKVIYKELTSDRSFKLKDKSTGNEIEPITIKREVQKKTEGGTLTTVQEEHVVWEVKRTKDELTVPLQYDYILKYPKSVLRDKSYQNFKLVAYNKKHAKGYQFGAVMRKALFPLD